DAHFDSLQFLNSAGAWSPDGRRLAMAALAGGKPVIALVDAASGSVEREIPLPGLDDALNASWSPDGTTLVLSGNRGGLPALYLRPVAPGPRFGTLEALTHDAFADLEPVFTPDGRSVVFTTERYSTDMVTLAPGSLRLARMDLATREVRPIPAFLQ